MPGIEQADLMFLDGADQAYAHQALLASDGDLLWRVNNSSIEDYAARASFYGDPTSLLDIIDTQIGHDSDNVGLDIAAGSQARALRDLMYSGVLCRALATNFEDRRSWMLRQDQRLGHVKGSLTDPATWTDMTTWQEEYAPDGFAIAMHRPVGGLQSMPPNAYFGAAHFILDRVRSGGMMFTQVPRSLVKARVPLAYLHASILDRPDVAEIIVSPPKPKGTSVDLADRYAVILKR